MAYSVPDTFPPPFFFLFFPLFFRLLGFDCVTPLGEIIRLDRIRGDMTDCKNLNRVRLNPEQDAMRCLSRKPNMHFAEFIRSFVIL